MPRVSPTLAVLREIRDELKLHREKLESHDVRLASLDERVASVEERITHSEIRIATELTAVVAAVNSVRDLLRERLDDRDRLDDHEKRIRALEDKGRAAE